MDYILQSKLVIHNDFNLTVVATGTRIFSDMNRYLYLRLLK